jgi:uncharacterized protein YcaQ
MHLMPRSATKPHTTITAGDARRIALRAQGLALTPDRPKTPADVLRRTGAVQLDTISVLARSHELVAYARTGPTPRANVEDAYWGQPARAFEYMAHANCILPIESWPYFAFRRAQMGRRVHGIEIPKKALAEVRARLREGPITATDVGGAREGSGGWWSWSHAKLALEALYLRGEAVCTTRQNWKRVYDLPERAIPADLLAREPSPAECYAYLVKITAAARGVATRRDLANYFRLLERRFAPTLDRAKLLDDAIATAVAAGALIPIEVEGWPDPAYADHALLRAREPKRHRATLLSPFDSLIWADPPAAGAPLREHTLRLFGYTYALEIYLPKDQRKHGYFTMPLLAGGAIAGHVDPAREGATLVARNVVLHGDHAVDDMATALREAAAWVSCDDVRLDRVAPTRLAAPLARALR